MPDSGFLELHFFFSRWAAGWKLLKRDRLFFLPASVGDTGTVHPIAFQILWSLHWHAEIFRTILLYRRSKKREWRHLPQKTCQLTCPQNPAMCYQNPLPEFDKFLEMGLIYGHLGILVHSSMWGTSPCDCDREHLLWHSNILGGVSFLSLSLSVSQSVPLMLAIFTRRLQGIDIEH